MYRFINKKYRIFIIKQVKKTACRYIEIFCETLKSHTAVVHIKIYFYLLYSIGKPVNRIMIFFFSELFKHLLIFFFNLFQSRLKLFIRQCHLGGRCHLNLIHSLYRTLALHIKCPYRINFIIKKFYTDRTIHSYWKYIGYTSTNRKISRLFNLCLSLITHINKFFFKNIHVHNIGFFNNKS